MPFNSGQDREMPQDQKTDQGGEKAGRTEIRPGQPQGFNAVPDRPGAGTEPSFEDYFALYNQFIQFKRKPLIRIASGLDRMIPEGGRPARFLQSFAGTLSVIKSQGLKEFFRRNRDKKVKKSIEPAVKAFFDEGHPGASAGLREKLLERFTLNPPRVPDVLLVSSAGWEQKSPRVQQLLGRLSGQGRRVFFLHVNAAGEPGPVVTALDEDTFLVELALYDGAAADQPVLSENNALGLENSIKQLRDLFWINTALVVIDSHHWRKLAVRLRERYGWKMLYALPETPAGTSNPRELARQNEALLLRQSDLVFPLSGAGTEKAGEQSTASMSGELAAALAGLFPRISAIIVTYNNLDLTKLCLESIEKNTEYPNYEVIIVDNASTDGTLDYLDGFSAARENILFIKNDTNLGFAAANNQGARAASGEYLIFLNNDTVVTPGWMFRLYLHLARRPSAGMVGPVTNAIGNEAKIEVDYSDLADINRFAALRTPACDGVSFTIQVLALYCCMISRELYDRVGGLDERYRVGMFEDDDLALKVEMEGLDILCAEDVFIHHFHGASFKKRSDEENQRIFHENRLKYETKWGAAWQIHKTRK